MGWLRLPRPPRSRPTVASAEHGSRRPGRTVGTSSNHTRGCPASGASRGRADVANSSPHVSALSCHDRRGESLWPHWARGPPSAMGNPSATAWRLSRITQTSQAHLTPCHRHHGRARARPTCGFVAGGARGASSASTARSRGYSPTPPGRRPWRRVGMRTGGAHVRARGLRQGGALTAPGRKRRLGRTYGARAHWDSPERAQKTLGQRMGAACVRRTRGA